MSLEVPVKVHGSRAGANGQSERFEEQTSTMIVFSGGGVLRLESGVSVGQMLVMTNLKSRQDAICRVVKTRKFPNLQSYVEIEFTRPQTGYWGVHFSSQRQASATAPAAPRSGVAEPEPAPKFPVVPLEPSAAEVAQKILDRETRPVRLPPAAPPKVDSPFAALGTQEKVQPAAATTFSVPEGKLQSPTAAEPRTYGAGSPQPRGLDLHAGAADAVGTLPANASESAASTPSRTPVAIEPDGAEISWLAENPEPTANVGVASPVAAMAGASDSLAFGLETESAARGTISPGPRQNWILVAAGIVVLLGTVAAGAWFLHLRLASSAARAGNRVATQPAPAAASAVPPAVASARPGKSMAAVASSKAASRSAAGQAVQVASIPANERVRSFAPPNHSVTSRAASAARPGNAEERQSKVTAPSTEIRVPAAAAEAAVTNASGSLAVPSAMKAHPLSTQRQMSAPSQAPLVDGNASSSAPAGLPGLGSSDLAVPPPPAAQPSGPAPVGGEVSQPRLISSVLPVYPFAARDAHVEGDVVIDTQISASGLVTHMKVISGPAMLREAALEALRRWKYQPSKLDGKPVAVQMLVTIRFRL